MFNRAEIYANHRLISKIKIHHHDEENKITISPKNRNEFLFFYPEEKLSIHFLNEKGTIHIYQALFEEIKMVRSNIFYQFIILNKNCYHNCKNEHRQKGLIRGLLSDFTDTHEIEILALSDKDMQIHSLSPLKKDFVEVLYYLGKKKNCYIAEIISEEIKENFYVYDLLIFRKEVI